MLLELRLVDPDGYTVNLPGAVARVLPEQTDTVKSDMDSWLSPADAAAQGHRLADYRIQTTNLTA